MMIRGTFQHQHRFLKRKGFKVCRVSREQFGLSPCSDVCDNALRWLSGVAAYKFRNMLICKNLHQAVNSSEVLTSFFGLGLGRCRIVFVYINFVQIYLFSVLRIVNPPSPHEHPQLERSHPITCVEIFLQNKLLVSLFSVDQNAIVVSCDRLAQKSEEPTQKDSDFVQLLCPKTVAL